MLNQNAIVLMQLKVKNKIRIIADGECMKPIINDADIIEITASDEYHIGDIVLVMIQNKLRIHRIISKGQKGYTTKGDHSYLADKMMDGKILGKAIINVTQNRLICKNKVRLLSRTIISNVCYKSYKEYLKVHNPLLRKLFEQIHKIGDLLLFHI